MMMGLFQTKESVTLNASHQDIIGILKTVDLANPYVPFHLLNTTLMIQQWNVYLIAHLILNITTHTILIVFVELTVL